MASVLASAAGINVLTSCHGVGAVLLAVAAGVLMVASGLLAAGLRTEAAAMRAGARMRVRLERRSISTFLSRGGTGPTPETQPFATHLSQFVSDHLGSAGSRGSAARVGLAAMVLLVLGVGCWFVAASSPLRPPSTPWGSPLARPGPSPQDLSARILTALHRLEVAVAAADGPLDPDAQQAGGRPAIMRPMQAVREGVAEVRHAVERLAADLASSSADR